jgi:TonB-linked SusC/RagA family outer membrane protein
MKKQNLKSRKESMRQVLWLLCMFCCTLSLYAQTGVLFKGKIVDTSGEPLPGAVVQVTGSTRGAAADEDGNFEITNVTVGTKLTVSFLGMKTKELTFDGKNNVTIVLEDAAVGLEEVQVVAFGQQKKSSVVASISTVKASDLRIPSANLTTALAGRIAGIVSLQNTGEPGNDNASFYVRGIGSFGYKVDPLILIDGFESTTNDLARLQVDDIESFSVLKDAQATVLYGSSAANGIITIKTKEGREGPLAINARLEMNVSTPTQMPEFLDGVEYMRLYNQAQVSRNPLVGQYYSEQKILSTQRGEYPMIYPNVDWYGSLFNKSVENYKARMDVSGGSQLAKYFVSIGWENENGLLKVDKRNNFNNNININRFSLRSNVIFNLTSTTTLDTKIYGNFENYTGPYETASSIFAAAMNSNPVDFPAVWEPDEANKYAEHILFGSTMYSGVIKMNPYAQMVKGYEDRTISNLTLNASVTQKLDFLLKNLRLSLKASANVYSYYSSRRTYSPYYYSLEEFNQITGAYKLFALNPTSGQSYLGDVQPGRDASNHYYFEGMLNWDDSFGDHNVGAMLVSTFDNDLATSGNSNSIYATLPERNVRLAGRVNYNFAERYFAEFAFGYNGSEKFTGEKRYGFFPAVGVGWMVSNESFYPVEVKEIMPMFKFRVSYGRDGNDVISGREGRFFFLSDISMGGTPYRWGIDFQNSYQGYSISRYANQDITWEISTKKNFGFEANFLRKESIKFSFDYFDYIRDRIYMVRQNFPASAGLEASISGNVGKVGSHGVDMSLNVQHSFRSDVWFQWMSNFTYSTNEYIELDEKNYPDKYLKKVGYNISQQWGLVAERLFVDESEIYNSPKQDFGNYEAGDIKYKDINGDGVINDNDMIAMGYPTTPEIQYGFGPSLGYKKFEFGMFFQGNARTSFFINSTGGYNSSNNTYGIAPFQERRNALKIVTNGAWTETNPDVHAFWPRLSTTDIANNTKQSSWWLRDNSFLRLKQIKLGYHFDKFAKLGLQNAELYGVVENVFVISSFKLWDPEQGANGIAYPLNRRFNIGLALNF